jgi:hypothetical protein
MVAEDGARRGDLGDSRNVLWEERERTRGARESDETSSGTLPCQEMEHRLMVLVINLVFCLRARSKLKV